MRNFIDRVRYRIEKFFDVFTMHRDLSRLRTDNEMKRYQIDALEARLRYINQQYDIVRREALQAEQVITGIKNHLRTSKHDASRAVKNMLSYR